MNMKEKVLVIFGSMSSEHEISCISASNVLENLDTEKYDISKIGIDKNGIWYYYTGNVENIKNNSWIKDLMNKEPITNLLKELRKHDIVFPVLHGKYGEDGSIQGLLEMAQVKYVGCNILGSSIAMDKILSKELVEQTGINVVPYITVSSREFDSIKEDTIDLFQKVESKLKYPVIVKPSKEGSSYGVTKVETSDNLINAIEFALKYDNEILIEKYISNRKEIECAVLEDALENRIYVSTPGEIVSANEFYDFNAKYENNKSHVKIPAQISDEQIYKIQEYSKNIFKKLRLKGLSRIDFFVSNDKIYYNEVNTMPGFTNISMYPMMLIHDGISYKNILNILISSAKL